jgi:CheY-like chemotaxis protein
VASTLLAVDDSVTMRKVLEITFASPDFRVVTANSPDAALQKLKGDKPDLVITDLSLEPMNGYDLCKAIKKASPGTPVLLLSSKQNAFDAAKGSAAQADDHMDKPFDTQQMIDKVKKLLAAQPAGAAKAPAAKDASAQTTPSMQAPVVTAGARTVSAPVAGPLPAAATAAAGASNAPPQRAKTLIYNPPPAGGAVAIPVRTPAGPTPVSGFPTTQPKAVPAPAHDGGAGPKPAAPLEHPPPPAHAAPATPAAATAVHVNGQMAAKLEQIGLTPTQVDAVLALSREVVERVVWEVVPVLAETLIREELSRLTK